MKTIKLQIPTDKGTLDIILSKTRDLRILIQIVDNRTGENTRIVIPAVGAVELSKALESSASDLKQDIRTFKLPDTVDEIVELIDRPSVALKSKGDPIVPAEPNIGIYKN